MALFGAVLHVAPQRFGSIQAVSPGNTPGQKGALSLDNILKLIPGDAVALFMFGMGIKSSGVPDWPLVLFLLCALVCAILRIAATKPVKDPIWAVNNVNWSFLIVSTVAFFFWAHAISDVPPVVPFLHGQIAIFLAAIVGIIGPLFVDAR